MTSKERISTPLTLPECPTLYPTEKEFEHPIHYLSSSAVLAQGRFYGILKIIPPKGWSPDFALNFDTFKFDTRIQQLPELSLRNRARADFLKGFNCFQRFRDKKPLKEGDNIYVAVSKPSIDLERRNKYGWLHMLDGSRIHIHDIFISRNWEKWLDLARDKDLVNDVVEYSNYLINALNLKKQNDTPSNGINSLDAYTSIDPATDPHLKNFYKMPNDKLLNSSCETFTTIKKLMRGPESFIQHNINAHAGNFRDDQTAPEENDTGAFTKKLNILAEIRYSTKTLDIIAKQQKAMKENILKVNIELNSSATDEKVIKVTKLKESCKVCYQTSKPETILVCDGCDDLYHMTCLDPPLKAIPVHEWFCSQCLIGGTGDYGFEEDGEEWTLTSFKNWITENWGAGSKGSEWIRELKRSGVSLDLNSANYIANNYRNDYMTDLGITEKEVEGLFWALVAGKFQMPDELEIRYGADIFHDDPTEISGFPTKATVAKSVEAEANHIGETKLPFGIKNAQMKYVMAEWNLTQLPFAHGSLFKYICEDSSIKREKTDRTILNEGIGDDNKLFTEVDMEDSLPASLVPNKISGMSVPWIYVGGPFSTFCWHKEDHYTMSANYCHLGASKQWYGIPAECCEEFERRIREHVAPVIVKKQGDLMHQLVTQIPLEEIFTGDSTLRIYKATQREGEFIVTFPKVYHSGFNYGFNVNEAVNFTIAEWVQYTAMAVREYRKVKKEAVFDIFKTIRRLLNRSLAVSEGSTESLNFCKENGIDFQKLTEMNKLAYWIYSREIDNMVGLNNKVLGLNRKCTIKSFIKQMPRTPLLSYLRRLGKDKYLARKVRTLDRLANLVEERSVTATAGEYEMNTLTGEEIAEEDEDEGREEVDLGICYDCKTRVHFQWVDVDLWADCLAKVDEQMEQVQSSASTAAQKLEEMQKRRYHKKEGLCDVDEFDEVIRRARERGLEEDGVQRGKRSRRRRRQYEKRNYNDGPIVIDDSEDSDSEEAALVLARNKLQREVYKWRTVLKWMHNRRLRAASFGHIVLCLECFGKEMADATSDTMYRVIACTELVVEHDLSSLALQWHKEMSKGFKL